MQISILIFLAENQQTKQKKLNFFNSVLKDQLSHKSCYYCVSLRGANRCRFACFPNSKNFQLFFYSWTLVKSTTWYLEDIYEDLKV